MNSNDSTTTLIPEQVSELTVTRSETLPGDVRVIAQGKGWTVNFWTTEADWTTDLADMVQRLTATQEKRS